MSSERKALKVFFYALLSRMRKLVTFGELGNHVDTKGTGSMRVVYSRVAISYGCPASFLEHNMNFNLLHGKSIRFWNNKLRTTGSLLRVKSLERHGPLKKKL
jgi:hypothetical protein